MSDDPKDEWPSPEPEGGEVPYRRDDGHGRDKADENTPPKYQPDKVDKISDDADEEPAAEQDTEG